MGYRTISCFYLLECVLGSSGGCEDENYLAFMGWLLQLEELSLSWIRVEGKLGTNEFEKQTHPTVIIIIIIITFGKD